jgi:DNA-binding NarL/FixJ family response regulator
VTVRVVVADDQPVVRSGLAALLDSQDDITVVGTAADGAEAIALCRRAQPDVALMDVRMPGMDGIEATRQLARPDAGAIKVLMLTTFDLDEYVYDALAAGASGFLLKDVTPGALFDAVRVVAGGDALLAPAITKRLIGEFARQRPLPSTPPEVLDRLTPQRLRCSGSSPRGCRTLRSPIASSCRPRP